ncbi:MAG TPA: rhamnogalacturonan acetylesterase [Acidobacteriota bacterium]|nr:rhamnogalacturonan acetylesterase [Acidobacteriota bacterium]
MGFVLLAGSALSLSAARLHLAGDSTMATKERQTPNPEYGWGEALPRYFSARLTVVNYAANGRSSKSFITEGRWQKLVDALEPGDWAIVQFGHNDQKANPDRHTDPRGAFAGNLRRMIADVRAKGATPILATSVARRRWAPDGAHLVDTHGDYITAVREVGAAEKVPVLELNALTTALEEAHGREGSKRLHLWIAPGVYARNPQKGWRDDTHYSAYGADRVAALAVQEIIRLGLPLADFLAGDSPVGDQPDPQAER